jgi:hypothetical protein
VLQHKEKRQQVVRNLLENNCVWGGHAFEDSAGAFLYKKNRVAELRLLSVDGVGDLRYMSVDLSLKPGYMNPATAVAVGVCYRIHQNLKRDAPWPPDFITLVARRVREDSVRFLGGVFECPSLQVIQMARSCGAMAPGPFAQVFKETSLGLTKYVFNPAFIFVAGEAKCTKPLGTDQPERPCWLGEQGEGKSSALVRATRQLSHMPRWTQDAAIASEHHRLLGNVKQKAMDVSWWKPWTHQLLLYVGSSDQAKPP